MTDHLLPTCICGATAAGQTRLHALPFLACKYCGVVRQVVTMTPERLAAWYHERYFDGVYSHTYAHDRRIAALRLAAYQLPVGVRLLDVGCGNGAFVHEARSCGLDAWGQDVALKGDGPFVYAGELLEDVAFPTDEFDVVTVHDVLEHLVDPVAALREIRRVLKPGGKLIVDFPRFWHESGEHHWKPIEHLWMLTEEQLIDLLKCAGFAPAGVEHPISSKVVVEAESLPEKRPQILVPAGIGDAYWVMVKLPGFLRVHGLGLPDVWVQDSGPRRTAPFLRTVPFVNAAGYYKTNVRFRALFHEAYMSNGRTVYGDEALRRNMPGIDWFVAYNGVLRHGSRLEDVDPNYGCAWRPRLHFSKHERAYARRMQDGGPYAVVYLVDAGMYSSWWAEFNAERTYEALQAIRRRFGLRIVFVGASWDKQSTGWILAERDASATWVNLIAQTTYEELAGVIRGASLVFGWPSGATLLGPVWRVPTALVWNRYFDSRFWANCAPPDAPYRTFDSRDLTADAVLRGIGELLR